MIIGYTTGVFDLFHVGHVNILRNAKSMCDYLIVGCISDDFVFKRKNKYPIIPIDERIEILKSIKYVDQVVSINNMDNMEKLDAHTRYQFNIIFVGDDWKGSDTWNKLEIEFAKIGVKIVYFPYTHQTSSTKINKILDIYK